MQSFQAVDAFAAVSLVAPLLNSSATAELASSLAARAWLPAGKGALILMLGGLAVLPTALLWSKISSGVAWVGGIEPGAARLGLGPCRIKRVNAKRCLVALPACQTCRQGNKRVGPCERERQCLEMAVSLRAPDATVVEIACRASGRGTCTFEIQRGRPS